MTLLLTDEEKVQARKAILQQLLVMKDNYSSRGELIKLLGGIPINELLLTQEDVLKYSKYLEVLAFAMFHQLPLEIAEDWYVLLLEHFDSDDENEMWFFLKKLLISMKSDVREIYMRETSILFYQLITARRSASKERIKKIDHFLQEFRPHPKYIFDRLKSNEERIRVLVYGLNAIDHAKEFIYRKWSIDTVVSGNYKGTDLYIALGKIYLTNLQEIYRK